MDKQALVMLASRLFDRRSDWCFGKRPDDFITKAAVGTMANVFDSAAGLPDPAVRLPTAIKVLSGLASGSLATGALGMQYRRLCQILGVHEGVVRHPELSKLNFAEFRYLIGWVRRLHAYEIEGGGQQVPGKVAGNRGGGEPRRPTAREERQGRDREIDPRLAKLKEWKYQGK